MLALHFPSAVLCLWSQSRVAMTRNKMYCRNGNPQLTTNNKWVTFWNQWIHLANCKVDELMDMNFESWNLNWNASFVISKILLQTEVFNFSLWDMCSSPDLINIQSKAYGRPGIVYFLLPKGYFLPSFVVLSLVFVFSLEEKYRVYSQHNKFRGLNQETAHSLEIKLHKHI